MSQASSDLTEKKFILLKDFHSAMEECQLEDFSFRQALNLIFPLLCHFLGTGSALIRFIDEEGKQVSLKTSDFKPEWSYHIPRDYHSGADPVQVCEIGQSHLIMIPLEDSGCFFGLCAFVFTRREGNNEEKMLIALTDYVSSLIRTAVVMLSPGILKKSRQRQVLSRHFCRLHAERLLSGKVPFPTPQIEEAVILRCELSSFTLLCEKILRTPRRVEQFLSLWTETLRKTIYHYEGIFLQRSGNAVQCLFGPPFFESSLEDLVRQALQASREYLDRVRLLGEQSGLREDLDQSGLGVELTGRCVIHCGSAVLGFFGPFREYTGEGFVMNQTERLLSHAPDGSILITETALSHIPGGPLGIKISQSESVDFEGPRMIVTGDVSEPIDYFRCVFSSV